MKVSVVMTARNRPGYLREAVEGLLEQNIPRTDFEVLVVDDCSDDGKSQLRLLKLTDRMRAAGMKFRPYFMRDRKGPGGARNFGNSMAQGDVIVVHDSDDVSLPERLAVTWSYFQNNRQCDLFYSGAWMASEKLVRGAYHPARRAQWDNLERHQDIWHPTMAYRRNLIRGPKGISYPCEPADVDYGFLLAAKRAGATPGFVDQGLVLYRSHPGQISREQHALQQKLAQEKRS